MFHHVEHRDQVELIVGRRNAFPATDKKPRGRVSRACKRFRVCDQMLIDLDSGGASSAQLGKANCAAAKPAPKIQHVAVSKKIRATPKPILKWMLRLVIVLRCG